MCENNRNIPLDIAKALTIYLVVLGHLEHQIVHSEVVNCIKMLHMPLFFCISGYFAIDTVNKYDLKHLLLHKFRSLLIPYYAWSSLAFVKNVAIEMMTNNSLSKATVVNWAIDIYVKGVSVWYLKSLFVAIFLLYILNKLYKRYAKNHYIVGGVYA